MYAYYALVDAYPGVRKCVPARPQPCAPPHGDAHREPTMAACCSVILSIAMGRGRAPVRSSSTADFRTGDVPHTTEIGIIQGPPRLVCVPRACCASSAGV